MTTCEKQQHLHIIGHGHMRLHAVDISDVFSCAHAARDAHTHHHVTTHILHDAQHVVERRACRDVRY